MFLYQKEKSLSIENKVLTFKVIFIWGRLHFLHSLHLLIYLNFIQTRIIYWSIVCNKLELSCSKLNTVLVLPLAWSYALTGFRLPSPYSCRYGQIHHPNYSCLWWCPDTVLLLPWWQKMPKSGLGNMQGK